MMKRPIVGGVLSAVIALAAVTVVLPTATTVEAGAPASPAVQAGEIPAGEQSLGTVRIGRSVLANGQPLAAGSYQVRLTAQQATPPAPGATAALERWVEFVQQGQVRGREVVSIISQAEIGEVAKGRPPARGSARVEMLKGNDYLRIWIHRGDAHYLIHMPPAG